MNDPDNEKAGTPTFYLEWRQGALLTEGALVALGLVENTQNIPLGIVISHDCDIGATSDKDAHIEIILGEGIEKMGEYALLKNPRVLDLEIVSAVPTFCRVKMSEKRFVRKGDILPDFIDKARGLDASNLRILTKWLAARYRRSAFPNSFEERLDSRTFKKIQNLVEKNITYLEEILFRVDDNDGLEASPDENHSLGIVIVIKSFDDQIQRMEAERVVRAMAAELEGIFRTKFFNNNIKDWNGIELEYCEATPISALTYEYFVAHQPWRLEHVSRDARLSEHEIDSKNQNSSAQIKDKNISDSGNSDNVDGYREIRLFQKLKEIWRNISGGSSKKDR